MEDMTAMYLSAVKGVLDSLAEYENNKSSSDIMYLLAQAQARWLTSALRYWQQIAVIIGTHGVDAVEKIKPTTDGASQDARRVMMLDKARAALREVSDLSLREAKTLQRDLMEIEAELRECMAPTGDDLDAARRFAKPIE